MIFNNNQFSNNFDWTNQECLSTLQQNVNTAILKQRFASIQDICDLVFGILIQYCPRPGGSDYADHRRSGWRNKYSTGSLVASIRYQIKDDYTFEFTIGGGSVDYASYTTNNPAQGWWVNKSGKIVNQPNWHWVQAAMAQAQEVIEEAYGGVQLDLTI